MAALYARNGPLSETYARGSEGEYADGSQEVIDVADGFDGELPEIAVDFVVG